MNNDLYWEALTVARKAIYSEEGDGVIASLADSPNQDSDIGMWAAKLMGIIARDMASKGSAMDDQQGKRLMKQIISDIVEIAHAKGVLTVSSQKEATTLVSRVLVFAVKDYAQQVRDVQQAQRPPQQPPRQAPQGLLAGAAA